MSDFDGEEYTDGVNSISFTMPKFKQWRTGRFYDYENQIADYSSLEELNDSIKEARIALFKVNETINQYERKAEEAKVRYGREWRREYMKAADKTDAGKKARADLMCERHEDDMIVNNQVKTELVRLSNSLRLELQTLQSLGNNLRQQLKME